MNFTKRELFLLSDCILKVQDVLSQSAANLKSMGIDCFDFEMKRQELAELNRKLCDHMEED